jgi:hypothetical protein
MVRAEASRSEFGVETRLPHLTDYWDERVQAVDRRARELSQVPPEDRERTLDDLRAAVEVRTLALPDELLPKAAIAIADDLYKAACASDRWDVDLGQYLGTTAARFFSVLAERGLLMQYVVDNTFDDLDRPLRLFPRWFAVSGLTYACPQQLAFQLMEADEEDPVAELLPRYITEARIVAAQLVDRCRAERQHFVYLDTDSVEESFEEPLAFRTKPGFVTVFRNDAPVAGTDVEYWIPE